MSSMTQRAYDLGVQDAFQKYAGLGGTMMNAVKSPFAKQVGQGLMQQAPQLAVTAGIPLAANMLQSKQPAQPSPQAQPALSPGA